MYIKKTDFNFANSELLMEQFMIVVLLANTACKWRDCIGRVPFAETYYKEQLLAFRGQAFKLNKMVDEQLLERVPRDATQELIDEMFLKKVIYPIDYDVAQAMLREMRAERKRRAKLFDFGR